MKKSILFITGLAAIVSLSAQMKVTRQEAPKLQSVANKNILDANRAYVKPAIKFKAFAFTPELVKKGYTAEKIYTWTTPDGVQHKASGTAILKAVNDMEQELNKRGHSLREARTFDGIGFNYRSLHSNATTSPSKKIITKPALAQQAPLVNKSAAKNKLMMKHLGGNIVNASNIYMTIRNNVYLYFGHIDATAEFPGTLQTETTIDNVNDNAQSCSMGIVIATDTSGNEWSVSSIAKGVVEISNDINRKPNDNTGILASASFDFKKPARAVPPQYNSLTKNQQLPASYVFRTYGITFDDLRSRLPAASKTQPATYYVYIKFYNDKNQLLYYGSYNTLTLDNIQVPPLQVPAIANASGSFNNAYTDPAGLFGIYYNATNITAKYSKVPDGWNPATITGQLAANMEIGAQYYNLAHLIDNSQPVVIKQPFISANMSANYTRKVGAVPVRHGETMDLNADNDYQFNYTLLGNPYSKTSSSSQAQQVNIQLLPKETFFIGPVPCSIEVDLTGTASISRNASITYDVAPEGGLVMTQQFTPHLDLTLTGSGGVDAVIAYAKVVVNVTVIQADMPFTLTAGNSSTDVNAQLAVAALSGDISFHAGVCIPIPFFDDICKDFSIDIFHWTGPNKTYPLLN